MFQRITDGITDSPQNEHRLTRIFAGEAVFLPRVADGTRTLVIDGEQGFLYLTEIGSEQVLCAY